MPSCPWKKKKIFRSEPKSTSLKYNHGSVSDAVFCSQDVLSRSVVVAQSLFLLRFLFFFFFFFNDTATTEIYTLSLHDALPISFGPRMFRRRCWTTGSPTALDRKSTRLNSSHGSISYAVFCLKKKQTHTQSPAQQPTQPPPPPHLRATHC